MYRLKYINLELSHVEIKKEVSEVINGMKISEGLTNENCYKKRQVLAYVVIEKTNDDKKEIISKPVLANFFSDCKLENSLTFAQYCGESEESLKFVVDDGVFINGCDKHNAVIESNEKVVRIVPCLVPTFVVFAKVPAIDHIYEGFLKLYFNEQITDDIWKYEFELVGYEVAGQPHPNWINYTTDLWTEKLTALYEALQKKKREIVPCNEKSIEVKYSAKKKCAKKKSVECTHPPEELASI